MIIFSLGFFFGAPLDDVAWLPRSPRKNVKLPMRRAYLRVRCVTKGVRPLYNAPAPSSLYIVLAQ
jgi:hypothetical protein